jgi:hypothetical protein
LGAGTIDGGDLDGEVIDDLLSAACCGRGCLAQNFKVAGYHVVNASLSFAGAARRTFLGRTLGFLLLAQAISPNMTRRFDVIGIGLVANYNDLNLVPLPPRGTTRSSYPIACGRRTIQDSSPELRKYLMG